jgi:cobalt-zinc-cadmium resistance protein CzcA
VFQVKTLYQNLLYHETLNNLYAQNDSLFATLVNAVQVRYRTGEGTLLEKTAVETQYMEIQNQQKQNAVTIRSLQAQLALMLQADEPVTIAGTFQRLPEPPSPVVDSNPGLQYWKQQINVAQWQRKLEVSRALPEISLGYFTQTLIGVQTINNQEQYFGPGNRFTGFMVGLSIPLWFGAHTARIKAASYNRQVFEYQEQAYRNSLLRETEDVLQNLQRSKSNLEYYEQKALPNADLLEKQSILAFRGGDIDYTTFLLNVRQALAIREHHLQALSEFNLQIISLEHLTGTR